VTPEKSSIPSFPDVVDSLTVSVPQLFAKT